MKDQEQPKPCHTIAFLAFLTTNQIIEMREKTQFHSCDYHERKGAKLHWVIANKHGAVCVEIKESQDIFKLIHEHNIQIAD